MVKFNQVINQKLKYLKLFNFNKKNTNKKN